MHYRNLCFLVLFCTASFLFAGGQQEKVEEVLEVPPVIDPVLVDVIGEVLISNVIEIQANDLPVTSLAGLENAFMLETLDLSNSMVTDLRPLACLPNLKNLCLHNTPLSVEDLMVLRSLPELEIIGLGNLGLENLDFLEDSSNLRRIDSFENPLKNVDALENLSKLREIHLEANRLTDLSVFLELARKGALGNGGELNLMWNPLWYELAAGDAVFTQVADLIALGVDLRILTEQDEAGGLYFLACDAETGESLSGVNITGDTDLRHEWENREDIVDAVELRPGVWMMDDERFVEDVMVYLWDNNASDWNRSLVQRYGVRWEGVSIRRPYLNLVRLYPADYCLADRWIRPPGSTSDYNLATNKPYRVWPHPAAAAPNSFNDGCMETEGTFGYGFSATSEHPYLVEIDLEAVHTPELIRLQTGGRQGIRLFTSLDGQSWEVLESPLLKPLIPLYRIPSNGRSFRYLRVEIFEAALPPGEPALFEIGVYEHYQPWRDFWINDLAPIQGEALRAFNLPPDPQNEAQWTAPVLNGNSEYYALHQDSLNDNLIIGCSFWTNRLVRDWGHAVDGLPATFAGNNAEDLEGNPLVFLLDWGESYPFDSFRMKQSLGGRITLEVSEDLVSWRPVVDTEWESECYWSFPRVDARYVRLVFYGSMDAVSDPFLPYQELSLLYAGFSGEVDEEFNLRTSNRLSLEKAAVIPLNILFEDSRESAGPYPVFTIRSIDGEREFHRNWLYVWGGIRTPALGAGTYEIYADMIPEAVEEWKNWGIGPYETRTESWFPTIDPNDTGSLEYVELVLPLL